MARKSTAKPRSPSKNADPSFVSRDEIYTLEELGKRLGLEIRTIREARRNGLKAKLVGGRRIVVRGADFDDWLAEHAPDAELPANGEGQNHGG